MYFKSGGMAAVAALLHCGGAAAQVPTIAGDYVETARTYCLPALTVGHGGGAVASVGLAQDAQVSYTIALEYYDPRTTVVTANGYTETGSALLVNDDLHGASGTPFAETHNFVITFYSNDESTATINGVRYHATWGVMKNTVLFRHVPEYFSLVAVDANGCVTESEHTRR